MALSLPHESSVSHYCTQSLRTWEIPSPLPLHPNPKPPIFFFRHFNMLIPIQIASFPVIGRRFATVTGFRIAEDGVKERLVWMSFVWWVADSRFDSRGGSPERPFGFVALVGGLTVVQVSIFLFQILICFLKTCVFDFVSILIWETLNIIFIVLDIFCALPSLFSVFYTLLFLWNHWLTALTIWPEWFGLNSWNFKMKGRKGWRWLTGFVGNGNLVRVMREEN